LAAFDKCSVAVEINIVTKTRELFLAKCNVFFLPP